MITIGPLESPRPRIPPASTWFTQLKRVKKTFTLRNAAPASTTLLSPENRPTAGSAYTNSTAAITPETASVRRTLTTVPLSALFLFPAPIFWLTNAVAAIDMLCRTSMIN